jgi:hypothetical protein
LSGFVELVEKFGSLGRFRRVLSEYARLSDDPEDEDHEEDRGTGVYVDVNEEDGD